MEMLQRKEGRINDTQLTNSRQYLDELTKFR
jgi:hypothetical protein